MAKYEPDEFFSAERHTGFLNPPSSYKNVVTVEGNCVDAHCTNADRIRAMGDEELAEWICQETTNALNLLSFGNGKPSKSFFTWLEWLKEASE